VAIGLAAERDMKARQRQVLSGAGFDELELALASVPRQGSALSRAVLRTLGAIATRQIFEKPIARTSNRPPRT